MNIEVVNVRLPEDITKWLDSLVENNIYKSRSEAIREFTREFIEEKKVK